MKQAKQKRLHLGPETIRALVGAELRGAAGGATRAIEQDPAGGYKLNGCVLDAP